MSTHQRTISVSITGGIGSGKSYVCRLLQEAGYPVYYADARAKALMTESPTLREQLTQAFGQATYHPDGTLNRPYLAAQVFGSERQLKRLNALVHPAVGADFLEWAQQQSRSIPEPAFVFKETALVFEAGIEHLTDVVWLVYAPRTLRLQRTLERDGLTVSTIQERMQHQWPDYLKLQRAHFAIFNDGLQAVPPQVDAALRFTMQFVSSTELTLNSQFTPS